MSPKAGPPTGPAPLIDGDERWEGEIRPSGSIVVAEGATLTLAPGARLSLAPDARVQVRGRLVAAGEAGAPVVVEASALSVIGDGSVSLRHAIFRGLTGDGVSFYQRGRGECLDCSFSAEGRFALNHRSDGALKLERCEISGARIGLSAFGGPLEARGVRFRDHEELALELSCSARLENVSAARAALGLKVVGGKTEAAGLSLSTRAGAAVVGASSLDWSAGECAAETVGVSVEGGEARLRGVAFKGGTRAISIDSGRCAAEEASFSGQSGAGVWCGEGGSVELSGCEFSGSPTGLGARGPATAARCRFSGHGEQALDLHGAGHRVSGARIVDCEVGAAVAGSADFSDVEASARRHALISSAGSRLAWRAGRASAEGTALMLLDSETGLRDLRVSGGASGAMVRGGRLSAAGCVFEKHADAALELDGGEHELSSVEATDCGTALLVSAGSCRAEGSTLSGREACALVRRGGKLALSKTRLSGAATGAFVDKGGLDARDCAFEGQQRQAVLCADASATLAGCSISGARKGVSARGGDAALVDCELSGQDEVSLEFFCAARLERVSAASRALALRVAGGRTEAESLVLTGRDGAEIAGEAAFAWNGGSCSAGNVGLAAEGGAVELRGVEFRGGKVGVRLGAGSLAASGCSFAVQEELSLELARPARLERVSAESRSLALKIVSGETDAQDLVLKGRAGAKVVGDSRLRWRGGACAAVELGLGVEGGEVELRGVRFEGGERGASVETGSLYAEGAVWEGQGIAGLSVAEGGRARLADCAFSGALTGAAARGPLVLSGCRLAGHAGQGLDLHGEGHELSDSELSGCGVAVSLAGRARFARSKLQGSRCAVALSPGGALDWREGSAASDGLAISSDDARAVLEGVRCEGAEGGALFTGGRLSAARCAFEGGGAALELFGGEHELSSVAAANAETGLLVSGGACRARGLELAGRASGLLVRRGGAVDWTGGRCEGRRALQVEGGEALVDDVSCAGASESIRLEGGSLRARRSRARGGSECGALVDGGAFCELLDCAFEETPIGVAARAGHVHLLEGVRFASCARAVAADPAASLCLRKVWDGGRAAPGARGRLLAFVLATKDRAPWRALYWVAYAAGAAWLRLRPACMRGVEAVRLHRGWITGDWQPGVSDLDALVVARRLSGEDGSRWLRDFWRRYAAWKEKLPFLGEVLIAERADFEVFVREGGARARAAAAALPGPPAAVGGEDQDGDLIECAHAYTRLLQCGFSPGEAWARNSRHAAKAFLDVLRYGPLREPGRTVLSRAQAAAELRRRGPEEGVRALDGVSGPEPGDAALALARAAAESLRALDAWAGPDDAPAPLTPSGEAPVGAREALDELRASFGPGMTGALVDELYRSYVLLDARGAEPEALAQSLAAAARRRPLLPGTLPVPLTRRLWRALARSPYMEDPTRGLGFAPGRTGLPAGRLLPGVVQSAFGECREPVALSPARARAGARSAAANLALTWRWLGAAGPGADPRVVFHYLLSRSLGLRLMLERDAVLPFFDLDALAARCSAEFPELAAPLSALRPLAPDATTEEAFFGLYPLIDGQARRLVALLEAR